MKRYRIIYLMLAMAIMTSGCITKRTTAKSNEYEGPEIRGTERFELQVKEFQRKTAGKNEEIRLVPEHIKRHYKVEKWRKNWNEVHRDRFLAVAGVHDNYNAAADLFVDPFAAALLGGIMTPIGVLAMMTGFGTDLFVHGCSALVSILPLVRYDEVKETVDLNIRERQLVPVAKTDDLPSRLINGKRIDWEAIRADGRREDSGRVAWPDPIMLPWCLWVLDDPLVSNYLVKVSSRDVELKGVKQDRLDVDLRDAINRQWPAPKDRPGLRASIKKATWRDKDGREVFALSAGSNLRLEVEVSNPLFSSDAYYLQIKPVVTGGPALEWGAASTITWLDSFSSQSLMIPVRIPLDTPTATTRISLGGTDVFGRSMDPLIVEASCVRTDLPELSIFSAVIRPVREDDRLNGHDYVMEVVVRNRGDGEAREVSVQVESAAENATRSTVQLVIPAIEPHARQAVLHPVKSAIRAGVADFPARFTLTEELGMAPVVEELPVAIIALP